MHKGVIEGDQYNKNYHQIFGILLNRNHNEQSPHLLNALAPQFILEVPRMFSESKQTTKQQTNNKIRLCSHNNS